MTGSPDDRAHSGDESTAADEQGRAQRLKNLGVVIAKMRDEAVQARRSSGIEQIWIAAEEANNGIDDVNRHETAGKRWLKSTVLNAGMQANVPEVSTPKPTAYFRLTSRYVDAAAAKIGEITLPVDGKGFSLKPDPVPQAKKLKSDMSQFVHNGQRQMRDARPDEMPPADPAAQPVQPQGPTPTMPGGAQAAVPPQPGQAPPPKVPLTVKDLAEHALSMAEESAQLAEQRIHGWLTNCQHSRQMRKVLYDGALYGTGVLKGPIPDKVRTNVLTKTVMGVQLDVAFETVPITKHVPLWNLYPDPACGECIHDGDHIFEVDHLTAGWLERLKEAGFYLNDEIDKVLKQGPGKIYENNNNRQTKTTDQDDTRFEIWYFYGQIKLDDFDLLNPQDASALVKEGHKSDSVYAIVTMVNDTIIRGTLNPLEKSGEFPYHVFNWRPRTRYWAGIGIAEQVDSPAKLLNAAVRAAMTNAALSAGPITVMNDNLIRALDGKDSITPYKIFGLVSDMAMEQVDVRKLFALFEIPNTTQQLLGMVEFAMKAAEEATNIPLVTQGQSGETTPDTFGGQRLQDNNATQLLRDVGYSVADGVTNPLIRQMNEWLLLDPKVPNEEKMNHQVDANGAIAQIEKALQDRAVVQLWPLAQDPATGFDKFKFGKAAVRSLRLHPGDWQITDEEMTKRLAAPQQPPVQIAVAQVRAQSAEKIAESHDQLQAERNKNDLDRDKAYVDAERERSQAAADADERKLQAQIQLETLKYANQQGVALMEVKAQMAQTSAKLQVQKELSAASLAVDVHKHHAASADSQVITPPTEPAGKAANGQAFAQ